MKLHPSQYFMNNKNIIFVGLVTLIIAQLIFYFFIQSPRSSPQQVVDNLKEKYPVIDMQTIKFEIPSMIDQVGIAGTLDAITILLSTNNIDISTCHNLIHLVGHQAYFYYDADYQKLATHGSLCGDGYKHGVEAQIALSAGDDVVNQMNEYCKALRINSAYERCYHGAGHAYIQSTKDIPIALTLCDRFIGGVDPDITDCYRGIFSEYAHEAMGIDLETGQTYPGGAPVQMDLENPLSTCRSLDSKYRSSCESLLSVILVSRKDPLLLCIKKGYDESSRNNCIQFVANHEAAQSLTNADSFDIPEYVFQFTKDQRTSYILGSKEIFWAYKKSGLTKDLGTWCSAFEDGHERELCVAGYN
jgi:hypothetical protein